MKTFAHTEAPWVVRDQFKASAAVGNHKYPTAVPVYGPRLTLVAVVNQTAWDSTMYEANARLIAAAPKLLAKTVELRDFLLDQYGQSEGVDELDALIAEIKG